MDNIILSEEETKYFKYILERLNKNEIEIGDKKPETIYDLIDILLNRIEKKNIGKMSKLIAQKNEADLIVANVDNGACFSIKFDS